MLLLPVLRLLLAFIRIISFSPLLLLVIRFSCGLGPQARHRHVSGILASSAGYLLVYYFSAPRRLYDS